VSSAAFSTLNDHQTLTEKTIARIGARVGIGF